MSDDHFAELMLIDFSRCQREALERWIGICATAGEPEAAEEIRQAIMAQDMEQERKAA